MINNYSKYIIIICVMVGFLIPKKFSSLQNKLTNEQRQIIAQANSLEKSGLIDEAIIAYQDILNKFPTLKTAFDKLKNIYISTNQFQELEKIAEQYVSVNNHSINSKIDVLDIYIITDNIKWKDIVQTLHNKPINLVNIKKTLPVLFQYDKNKSASSLIDHIRSYTKHKAFYALELGNFFTLKLDFNKAIDEYLIYLSERPKNIQFITQRIMLLADYNIAIDSIKNKLLTSNSKESKIILSSLEFKLKNYKKSYEILNSLSDSNKEKLELSKDLIEINKFDLAETIINDIINSSTDKILINKAIFQLGTLYELQAENSIIMLPVSNNIYKNQILNSPYMKLDNKYNDLLFKAINIYDSLSTYNNDYKSSLHLAEIKYKIIGDLDGAEKIYNNIYQNYNILEQQVNCLENIIDINLSKGDIDNTISKIDFMYNKNNSQDILDIIGIKKVQSYFYKMNRDSVIYHSNELLKSLSKDHTLYNDILDILSLFYNYKDNEILKYSEAKYKLIQNKKNEAINILDSINKNNPLYFSAQFESIYLEILEGNYDNALEKINNIEKDTNLNNYIEEIILLEGEIYDYILSDYSKAADIYLNFLDLFPDSIYYDLIRLRLRELAS